MSTSRKTKFLKDFGVYAIGNLGAKIAAAMLFPIYTYFVVPDELGYYDLLYSVMLCLLPFVAFQLRDGAFRFIIDAEAREERSAIITSVGSILLRNCISAVFITFAVTMLFDIRYVWLTLALLIVSAIYDTYIQLLRGLGHTKAFVGAGILNSLLLLALSFLFVMWLRMGVAGILLSAILSRLFSIIAAEMRVRVCSTYIHRRDFDRRTAGEILRYSLPLIPGTVLWWVILSSNRLFIEHFLGLEENGLFAVAVKFSKIIDTIAVIFYQTWQENAFRHYNTPDRNSFFSAVFNNYFYILGTLTVLFPFVIRLNYFWLVNSDYDASAAYLYLVCIVSMLTSITEFFNMGYQCAKDNRRTLWSYAAATALNLVLNYALVKCMGLYGIILASILTFLMLFACRAVETRRYFTIAYTRRTMAMALLVAVNVYAYFRITSTLWTVVWMVLMTALLLALLPPDIRRFGRMKEKS